MISIIICSANSELLKTVKSNIDKTIGVEHEIIAYDNSDAQRGICEVYNEGARDAKYNILCFMHEDVELNTPEWGARVLEAFGENERLGLLGIAGSSFKSYSPSGWDSTCMRERINFSNLLQKYKYSASRKDDALINKSAKSTTLVAVVDGVWFCSRNDILLEIKFDQQLLRKFHGYDIDISLAIGQRFDVAVTSDVLLTHYSEGNFNKEWIEEMLLLHEKWKPQLPVNVAALERSEIIKCEQQAFKSFITTMRKSGISSLGCIQVLNRSGVRRKFGWGIYARLYLKCLSR